MFLALFPQFLVCFMVVTLLIFCSFTCFFSSGPPPFSFFGQSFLVLSHSISIPFCLLCPHTALGCSHMHRVVWFPSTSSWACLGRALSRGLTLPLCFSLSLYMVGTRRSCKLSHCPRDIPGQVREGTSCGEWGGDNWRGRLVWSWVNSPSLPYKAGSPRSLPVLGDCKSVLALFLACKGAVLALQNPAAGSNWVLLSILSPVCVCREQRLVQWGMYIFWLTAVLIWIDLSKTDPVLSTCFWLFLGEYSCIEILLKICDFSLFKHLELLLIQL